MWKIITFAVAMAVITILAASGANGVLLTQLNDSSTIKNFTSYNTVPQNFSAYVNIPISSSVDEAFVGSVRGFPIEITGFQDAYVQNYGGALDVNFGGSNALLIFKSLSLINRAYIKFNVTVNPANYNEILLSLPFKYNSKGNVSIGVHEVYDLSKWDEGNITWNNQPCGDSNTVINTTNCNDTAFVVINLNITSSEADNCGNNQTFFNITELVKKRSTNASLFLRVNSSLTTSIQLTACSKESTVARNTTYPAIPSLYYGLQLYPYNVTFFVNNTFASQNLSGFNSTNNYNISVNHTLFTNYSEKLGTPTPLTLQLGGPGILQLGNFQFNYTPPSTDPILAFNNTANYIVSWNLGNADFVRLFLINNTGGQNASNCTFITSVSQGGDLSPFFAYPNNFSVPPGNGTFVNLTVHNPAEGTYDNNINVRCEGSSPSLLYTTNTPVNFIFSISSPSSSSGGGGGGVNVIEVSGQNLSVTPNLVDLIFLSFPNGNSVWQYGATTNVRVTDCQMQNGFECKVERGGTLITMRKNIPHQNKLSDTYISQLTLTSFAGDVVVLPVRVRVFYASLLSGVLTFGAAFIGYKFLTRRGG